MGVWREGRKVDRWMDGWMDGSMGRRMKGRRYGTYVGGYKERMKKGWMDGWTDGWQMDEGKLFHRIPFGKIFFLFFSITKELALVENCPSGGLSALLSFKLFWDFLSSEQSTAASKETRAGKALLPILKLKQVDRR